MLIEFDAFRNKSLHVRGLHLFLARGLHIIVPTRVGPPVVVSLPQCMHYCCDDQPYDPPRLTRMKKRFGFSTGVCANATGKKVNNEKGISGGLERGSSAAPSKRTT